MKTYSFFIMTLFTLGVVIGCSKESDLKPETQQHELTLTPSMQDLFLTRGSNNFFANGDQVKLIIIDHAGTFNYTYAYNNNVLRGLNAANTYRFFMDDQAVTSITASWPFTRSAPITDQRKDVDFKKADYMTASLKKVMVTREYVPIVFKHENAKVVFVVTGQNTNGVKIESLVVNINNTGYWAHTDPATGHAEVIVPPGNMLIQANEIAGLITVNGVTGSMIFQVTKSYNLVANTSYVVTLSPQGDNIYASISIGGWYQNENGVAVPIIQQNGYYMISNEAQLFAVAQLVANYLPDSGNADWSRSKYMLSNDLVRAAPLRNWNTLNNFSGEFNYNGHTISPNITFATGGNIIQ